jgi:hypothetical protein
MKNLFAQGLLPPAVVDSMTGTDKNVMLFRDTLHCLRIHLPSQVKEILNLIEHPYLVLLI